MKKGFKQPLFALLVAGLLLVPLAACDREEGPMEELGESVDEAVDEVKDSVEEEGDGLEEAVDEIEDAAEELGEEVEEAVEGDGGP